MIPLWPPCALWWIFSSQPTAFCALATAYCPLPTACCLLRTKQAPQATLKRCRMTPCVSNQSGVAAHRGLLKEKACTDS